MDAKAKMREQVETWDTPRIERARDKACRALNNPVTMTGLVNKAKAMQHGRRIAHGYASLEEAVPAAGLIMLEVFDEVLKARATMGKE